MMRKNKFHKGPKWQQKAKIKRPLIVKHPQTIVIQKTLETAEEIKEKSSLFDKFLLSQVNNVKKALIMHLVFALTYGFLITQVIYDGINDEGFSFYRISFSQASGLFLKISIFIALLIFGGVIAIYLVNKAYDDKASFEQIYIKIAKGSSVSWFICAIMAIIALFDPGTHIGLAMVLFVLTCFAGMMTIQIDADNGDLDKKVLSLIAGTGIIFILFVVFLTMFSNEFLRLFTF